MTENELKELLNQFRKLPAETEWLEFKEAKANFDFNKLGKYFSALSNEANLKNRDYGWLIFGVEDKKRRIVGTNYRADKASLDSLKAEIATKTGGELTFENIFELRSPSGRVLMFQVPPAPQGIPTSWEGHYYGRAGESLCALNIYEIERIRGQNKQIDWSAQICEDATVNDLDEEALALARTRFKERCQAQSFYEDIDGWDTDTFLEKAKITSNGKITRAALLLLGKPESTHYLSPLFASIVWKLDGYEKDFEYFDPPFLLSTGNLYKKIRNIRYKILPGNTLFPVEVEKYDSWVVLEALHNCIAHQDYMLRSRIIVTEKADELIFLNAGNFYEGTVEDYTLSGKTPQNYRNPFLVRAMVNLGMIETMGFGIIKMFIKQKERFFPLPQYDLSAPDRVELKIIGKMIDENYTTLLVRHTDLSLETVIYLDKVQKKIPITKSAAGMLRKQRLVEGRYPHLFVVPEIAAITEEKSTYIKYRAFNNAHYKQMVLSFIENFGSASRQEINNLLLDKISEALSEEQKTKKINNLLQKMARKDNTIRNTGTRKKPIWVLNQG